MKWLEIIEICSVSTDRALLEKQIMALANQITAGDSTCTVKVFKNGFVDTDFSIHLFYESENNHVHRSALSEQIIAAFKDYGIINHSLWIQQR